MKALRIFLAILIVIGIVLLATQKFWVPKVVDTIITKEEQQNITLVDGRQCYTYSHEGTPSEPYTVSEFIDMTITGTNVVGTKTGTQNGPDMTNGYQGVLLGTLANNAINVVYYYTVEGSQNKEKEIYLAGKTGIEKLRYPLKEEGGILVPDTTQESKTLLYARVGCTGSN